MVHWQLLKGVLFISLAFCAFSVPFECKALLFFMSLAVSALLVAKTFYPAAVKTGIVAGIAILLNMAVWFVFHSMIGIIQSIGFLAFAIIIIALLIALAPRMGRMASAPYINVPPPTNYSYQNGVLSTDLYHGTPDLNNVRDIVDYGGGFIVGQGNTFGTGVYFTDQFLTARFYAKGSGGIVKVNLQTPVNQIADFFSIMSSEEFSTWISRHGSGNIGDDTTNFTLQILRKRFISVSQGFCLVALANKTANNERVIFEGITIRGALDINGNPI